MAFYRSSAIQQSKIPCTVYLYDPIGGQSEILQEIDKHAARNQRVIRCLFQIYIAREETKFGMDETELDALID